MLNLSVKVDTRQALKVIEQAKKQAVFASMLALNNTARTIAAAEKLGIASVFAHPRPFTVNAVAIAPRATKVSLSTTIFIKPKTALYLAPYEDGQGGHFIPSRPELGRVLLEPVHEKVDAYGQFPAGAVARLLARPDVFVGEIHGILGIWQRPLRGTRRDGTYGTKGKLTLAPSGRGRTGLILLAKVIPNQPVHKHLDFVKRGGAVFRQQFPVEFERAFAAAMANARK